MDTIKRYVIHNTATGEIKATKDIIIMDPKEMERIQASDSEEFLRQRRLIADLALWDGWDPVELQPYIDYLDRLEEEEESGNGSFSTIVVSKESQLH